MSEAPDQFRLHKHEDGYLEVLPRPSSEYLEKFYNSDYFNAGTYSVTYSDLEIEQKYLAFKEAEVIFGGAPSTIIDIGCGEGFSVDYFNRQGWEAFGVDFTSDGVKRHFPELQSKIKVGDIFDSLDKLIKENKKFDFILCNNVIEHVLDPKLLLYKIKKLSHAKTMCRLQLPNDNSWLQIKIVESGFADANYWFCPPAHLSYFTTDEFKAYIQKNGFKVNDILVDFPIELFLLNQASNYKKNPAAGKEAHKARIEFETTLARKSIHDLIAFKRGCGLSGTGRNTTIYCSPH